jgi:transcriptional regulator of acetoin/glycerol metabolism
MKSKNNSSKKNRSQRPEKYLEQLRRKLGVRTLYETKLKEVKKALSVTQGDKVLAAALLGIGKTTIYRTLQD